MSSACDPERWGSALHALPRGENELALCSSPHVSAEAPTPDGEGSLQETPLEPQP